MIFETFAVLAIIMIIVVFTALMCAIAISVAIDWKKESEWEEICKRANKRAQTKEEKDDENR